MNELEIREKIASLLEKDFNIKLDGVDYDKPIFEQIAIDSMLLVAIAARIEQEFAIELPLSIMENPTLGNLIGLVAKA